MNTTINHIPDSGIVEQEVVSKNGNNHSTWCYSRESAARGNSVAAMVYSVPINFSIPKKESAEAATDGDR